MAERERTQERPERRRRIEMGEELAHPAVAQHGHESMESAPATMPPTREATFNPAFAPLSVGPLNHWPASRCRPAFSASFKTGTSPAADTRFGSSTEAGTACTLENLHLRDVSLLGTICTVVSAIYPEKTGILGLTRRQIPSPIGGSRFRRAGVAACARLGKGTSSRHRSRGARGHKPLC